MAPELPTDEVTAAAPSEVLINSQSVIAQPTAISSNPKPDAKPTCPYCGKSLTHDRSRCPMIRAKDSTTIEQRIAELKQNTAEDTDNVGAHAIEVLENALLRKQGATVKKKASSNVSSDHDSRKNRYLFSCQAASSARVKPVPPAKPLSTVDKISSTTKMTLAVPPSSFSPSSCSFPEGNGRLQKANTTRKSPLHEPALRVSPSQKFSSSSLASQTSPRQTLEDTPATDSESQSQDSSEAKSSEAKSSHSRAQAGSSVSNSDEDSNEESSPERETTSALHSSRQLDPIYSVNVSGYSDKDLEAIIRGPGNPLKPTEWSSESSEDEETEDIRPDDSPEEGQELERSLEPQKPYVLRNESSDEEVGDNNGSESDNSDDKTAHSHKPMASIPPIVAHAEIQDRSREIHPVPLPVPERFQSPQGGTSFQEMDRQLGSMESEKGGNDAFEQALEEENTVLGLAQQGPSYPSAKEVMSQSPRTSPGPNQSGGVEVKESDPTESEANNLETNLSEFEEAEPARVTGSDPIEAPETLDPHDSHVRQGSLIEDYEGPTPALPLQESSITEPERAATPKPGIFGRMKSHMKLAREERTSSLNLNSNLTVAPSAKPRSRAVAKKRIEQSESDEEDQDIPPRRSARVPVRKAVDNPQPPVTSLPNGSQSLAKKTRQVRTIPRNHDAAKPSRPQTRGTQNTKKGVAKAAAKSPTPSSPKEDVRSSVVEGQASELVQEVRFPLSSSASLGAQETMRSGTSVGHTHSDVMIDELQSDSDTTLPVPFSLKPQSQHKSASLGREQSFSGPKADHTPEVRDKGEVTDNNPLFILSESQTAFPHSQFQSQLPDPRESTSSGSEEEVRETIIKKHSVKQRHPAQYRPLSDIAGEASKLFTPKVLRQSIGLRATDRVPKQRKERLSQMYGKMGMENIDDGSDDDSGKGSESDAEISHIPKSRKAGARLKGRISI